MNNLGFRLMDSYLDEVSSHREQALQMDVENVERIVSEYSHTLRSKLALLVGTPSKIVAYKSVLDSNREDN